MKPSIQKSIPKIPCGITIGHSNDEPIRCGTKFKVYWPDTLLTDQVSRLCEDCSRLLDRALRIQARLLAPSNRDSVQP